MAWQVVLDTNVLVAALRSRQGASFALLSRVGSEDAGFEIHLSVPLLFEYEDVLQRQATATGLTQADIGDVLDFLCAVAHHRQIFFLWRPVLRDPRDDMVLELAVEARADYVVTFNTRDFAGAEQFGVQVTTPGELLRKLGGNR
jgi:putative PIN family toxin of toxin-antitoxin system